MQPSVTDSLSKLFKPLTQSSINHGTYRTTEEPKYYEMYSDESKAAQTKAGWERPPHRTSGIEMRKTKAGRWRCHYERDIDVKTSKTTNMSDEILLSGFHIFVDRMSISQFFLR